MADLSKLMRKGGLGVPPPMTEASSNLEAPESAPAALPETPHQDQAQGQQQGQGGRVAHDGRTARRTGRTLQFATRVSEDFDTRLRDIATRDGLMLVEVLEHALDAYEGISGVRRK